MGKMLGMSGRRTGMGGMGDSGKLAKNEAGKLMEIWAKVFISAKTRR
jgi:hypothetical protein